MFFFFIIQTVPPIDGVLLIAMVYVTSATMVGYVTIELDRVYVRLGLRERIASMVGCVHLSTNIPSP